MPTILGIGGLLGHDGNAALIVDGKLIAASQEERFSRRKHDGAFPRLAIDDCLRAAAKSAEDIDWCVLDAKPIQSLIYDRLERPSNALSRLIAGLAPRSISPYEADARRLFPQARIGYAWHHLTHAAGAFYTSPFDRAAFLCIDGKGEDINATIGVIDNRASAPLYELPYANGLGLLYTLVTYYLGFWSFGSEYKVMGLAPYGRPAFVAKLKEFVESDTYGALRLKTRASFRHEDMKTTVELLARHLGIPARGKADPLAEAHVDIAASIQELFEEETLKMARFAREVTGEANLLFCGGCAQNCVTAGKLRNAGIFDAVFNSPVGGDMGTGLGAAALTMQHLGHEPTKLDVRGYYLGPEPGLAPDEASRFEVPSTGSVHRAAAQLLSEGYVVGWVRGRMELGARALGARSILADPRVPRMQSVLNLKVKFRESFRPFAPAILGEDCADWFDTDQPSDFMQYTAYLLPRHRRQPPTDLRGLRERLDFERSEISSVIHVDYSARIQTVRKEVHPDFHQLISEFKQVTGVPIIINTSFNVSGQPIVCTATEAWECFRHTDMDFLVINDRVYRNPNDKTREEKLAWLKRFEKSA